MKRVFICLAACFFSGVGAMEDDQLLLGEERRLVPVGDVRRPIVIEPPGLRDIRDAIGDDLDLAEDRVMKFLREGDVTPNQLLQLSRYASARNGKSAYILWSFVEMVSAPLSQLSFLVAALSPLMPLDDNSKWGVKSIVSACGVSCVAFDRVNYLAQMKMWEREEMEIILQAVKKRRKELGMRERDEDAEEERAEEA
jgi:hypothetical protein